METTTSNNATVYSITNRTVHDNDYLYLKKARYSTVALFAASLYLCVVLLVYEIRTAKNKRPTVNHLLLFSAVNALVSCTSQLLELFVGVYCAVYRWVNAITLVLGVAIVYTVIWSRQRNFYLDPLLKRTVAKPIRWISKGIIVGVYVALGSLIPTFVLTYDYILSEYGCIVQWSGARVTNIVLPLLFCILCGNTLFQFTLLGLVVYPLCVRIPSTPKQVKNQKNLLQRTSSTKSMRSDIQQVVRRLSIATFVCVLSTLIANVFVVLSVLNILQAFYSNLFVLDLLVNTVASVCSFVNWKKRLFPFWCSNKIKSAKNKNHLTTVTAMAS